MPRKTFKNNYVRNEFKTLDTCKNKKAFNSKQSATKKVELLNLENSSQEFDIYECDFCRKWHIKTIKKL